MGPGDKGACAAPQCTCAGFDGITSLEVAEHAAEDDCWIIIEGGVFDARHTD